MNETMNEYNQNLHSLYPGYKFIVIYTSFKNEHCVLNHVFDDFWSKY